MVDVVPNGLLGGMPVEILQLILTDDTFSRRDWRFCTRPVCRLWLDLMEATGRKGDARDPSYPFRTQTLDKRLSHQRFRHGWGVSDRLRSCGLSVRATTMVEWAHMRPDLWDHQPDAFYRLCSDRNRSNRGDAAIVLVATGRAPMIDYVLNEAYPTIADMMAKGQHDAVNGKTDPDCYPCTQYTSIEQLQDCLVDVAGVWGDLSQVQRVIASVCPAFVVHKRVQVDWFLHSPDIGEYMMRAGVGFPHPEHLHGATDDHHSGDDDNDDPASADTDRHDRETWKWLALTGATDLFDRLLGIASRADENPNDAFAQRIARTLAQNCKTIANNAVEPNSMGILRLLEPMMDEATVTVVMERACRSLVPLILEWIVGVAKTRSFAIPLFRLAKLAVSAFFTRHDTRPSPDTECIIKWLCAPTKGDYQPTQAEWAVLMDKAMKEEKGDPACAMWLAEQWPERLQRGHISGMWGEPSTLLKRLVRLTCATSTRCDPFCGTTTGAMDRLVLLLDLCAERGVLTLGSIDLWPILIETINSTKRHKRSSATRVLKYACLRCTGIVPDPKHDYGDPLCPRTVREPQGPDATSSLTGASPKGTHLPDQDQGLSGGSSVPGEATDGQTQGGDATKTDDGSHEKNNNGGGDEEGDDLSYYDPYSTTVHEDGVTYEYTFAPSKWESFHQSYHCDHLEQLSRTWDAPAPAPQASWQRWCRARPLTLADLVPNAAHIEDPSKDIRCVYYGFLVKWIRERLDPLASHQ